MAVTQVDGGKFIPIRSGEACPICGSKKGRCAFFVNGENEISFYRCKNAESDKPSNGWYIHPVKNNENLEKLPKKVPKVEEPKEMTYERMVITDKVYRYFRELVKKYEGAYVNVRDMGNLLDRGLTPEQVERMFIFSMPTTTITSEEEFAIFKSCRRLPLYCKESKYPGNPVKVMYKDYHDGMHTYDCKLETAISRDLERKFGTSLLNVAGFLKRRDSKSNEYITFKTFGMNPRYEKDPEKENKFFDIQGFFVPYVNENGFIEGLQYRLTVPLLDEKGRPMRYFWYSSSSARSGSPVDYYIPSNIYMDKTEKIRDDIFLLTEGGLKGKIASEKLGFKTLSEAGVNNYRRLVSTLSSIRDAEKIQPKVILALDMDKYENEEVLKAEAITISLLKKAGFAVAIAKWDGKVAKGIDDACVKGLRIKYKQI